MFTLDNIKTEIINGEEWWVFPDGFHVNKTLFPDKKDALKLYKSI